MKKIINFILGMLIVFFVQFFCTIILNFLKISFPAPILGIISLFLLLKLKIIKEDWVKDFCKFITKHMILFFIPIFVGIINYFDLLKDNLGVIFSVIFLTTTLMIALIGLLIENLIKHKRLRRIKRGAR